MKNKIIALMLILTLVLPFGSVFAKVSEDKVPELMQALEFITSSEIAEDKEITRGEFVILAAKLVTINNYKNLASPCKFKDVTEEDKFYHEVNLLQQMGIIHGENDAEFRPNDPIELNDACKILIHIMGYQHFAFNGNYLAVADQRGLLSGLNVEGNTFSCKSALKLIYNTLEADISDYNQIDGASSNEYSELFMTKRLGIYKIKATVTDDSIISLTGDTKIKEGYLLVGGELFKNDTDRNDLLGYTIEGFYKKDIETNENVMIYAFVKETETIVKTLSCDQIANYDAYTYEYYPDVDVDEKEELFLDFKYKIIYNGKIYKEDEALPTFTKTIPELLQPETGSVRLTDTDSDGDFDIVSVLDYESYIISSIDYDEYKIYGKSGVTPGTVDFSAAINSLNIITPNGDYIKDFAKILVDDVVSIGFSADGRHAEVVIANKKGEGFIQSADAESYVIGDETYNFAPEYVTYIQGVDEPTPGTVAEYYLTFENKIIYAKKAGETNAIYARITGVKGKLNDFNPQLSLQLYLENNSYDYYEFAKNVWIDGVRYKEGQLQDIYNYLFVANNFSATGEYYGIVLVKLNADDEIYFIDTPYKESAGNPNTLTEGDNTLHVLRRGEKATGRYIHSSFSFQGYWLAHNDAKFIVVADVAEKPEEDMLITNITTKDASNINTQFVEMMAFSTEENSFIADAVVRIVEKYKGSIPENGEYKVILKVSDALNKAGEPVKKVTVTNGKVIKDYYTEDYDTLVCTCGSTYCAATPIEPGPGDIVKFTLDGTTIVDGSCFVAYDYSEDKQWTYVSERTHLETGGVPTKQNSYGSWYARYAVLSGYMNKLDFETSQWVIDFYPYRTSETYRGNFITDGPYENFEAVYTLRDAYTITVNPAKGTMRPRLNSEIKQYDNGLGIMKKYFLLMYNGYPYCIVEYEN